MLRNRGHIRTTARSGSHLFLSPAPYNMQLTLVMGVTILALTQTTAANPVIDNRPQPQVLHYETANLPNSYKFHYDASDGSSRSEQGAILNQGTPNAALDVLGTVRWYDDKGQLYQMSYKAGKRGYRTIIKKVVS